MIEQQKQRVEQEITKMIDDMDKTFLRKMQIDMHYCAAKCCENSNYSIDRVQQCVEQCSTPLSKAQRYVHKELDTYQNRLQRCVMDCNDDVKDKMGPNPSESDINKYTDQFEKCAVKCVDKHVNLIPQMLKSIKQVLSKGPSNIPDV